MGSRTSSQDSVSTNFEKRLGWTQKIKKENDSEIKEFAETAMNELLGWYGYDKLARDDAALLQGLPLAAKGLRPPQPPPSDVQSGGDTSEEDKPPSPNVSGNKTPDESVCGWCSKTLPVDSCQTLTSANGSFCSELCFSQSRRASFKKNKTCDWCKHVRHTVSYVDFQDGASQLQFCSDKCLNQYKMHIFCREAQAHLELHPHMHSSDTSVPQVLITPDLWMRNCRSPSSTEVKSSSPSPPPSHHPNPSNGNSSQIKPPTQTSPLPLITVTHPSKLMPFSHDSTTTKDLRNERTNKHRTKKRRTSQCSSTITSSAKEQSPVNCMPQDLRIQHTVSPPRPVEERRRSNSNSNEPLSQLPPEINEFHKKLSSNIFLDSSIPPPQRAPNLFFANRYPNPMFSPDPRLLGPQFNFYPRPPIFPPRIVQPSPPAPPSIVPPVTVLVPYPIILPVPLPIPLPVPLHEFLKAASESMKKKRSTSENEEVETQSQSTTQENEPVLREDDTKKLSENCNDNIEPKTCDNTNENTTTINSTRPLRKRKQVSPKEKNREMCLKTRKFKYLSA